jgi:biotin transport system substrate-specific component
MTAAPTRPASAKTPTLAEHIVAPAAAHFGPTARDIALVTAGALLIALSAAVSIRLPDNPVPITGQTFGVLLAAGALGGRRGIAATAPYVLVGVIGLPAFAEGKGGVGASRMGSVSPYWSREP